ncbi:MAG: carbohydrate kinase family protein [Patescibacteria group bacterium]
MHDFIAVGDIVKDTFIKLKEAKVTKIDDEHSILSIAFGEKIPFESATVVHAVGNSPNAAVAAARLGLSSALISNLGDDSDGKDALAVLEAQGVDVGLVKTHQGKTTNNHYVLWYGDDRTILVKHEEYPYKFPEFTAPKWLYLSSLGESTLDYHNELLAYIILNSDVLLAFQPGTFQMKLGTTKLKEIYKHTKIFFCNVQEAEDILGVKTLGIKELIKRMHNLGPKIIVLTDGHKGTYASSGDEVIFQPIYPDEKPPYERTGAGDAFASSTVAALALGKNLEEALKWGSINAQAVVQEIGAQKGLLTRKQIEDKLKSAPESFNSKIL